MILLDNIRKLKQTLKEVDKDNNVFGEMSKLLQNMISSNVLILNKEGKIMGISESKSFFPIKELLSNTEGSFINSLFNERFMTICSTYDNAYLPNYGFSEKTKNYYSMIAPISFMEERLGTLFIYRPYDVYGIDEISLCEYFLSGICLYFINLKNNEQLNDTAERERISKAINSLSKKELDAMMCLMNFLGEKDQKIKIIDFTEKYGFSRSLLVFALKKFSSAGIIEIKNSGRKGTDIKFCTKISIRDEMAKTLPKN